jgi:hypothetical protein
MGHRYEAFVAFDDITSLSRPTPLRELAIDIEKMLAGRGIKIMSAQLSRKHPDQKAIDTALGDASVLVVVANSPKQLEYDWVKYAWTRFTDDEASGIKPKGMVFPYIQGFEPYQLPSALRKYKVITHGDGSLGTLFNAVAKALGPDDSQNFLATAHQLYEAMSEASEDVWCASWMDQWEYLMWAHTFNRPLQGMQTNTAINDNVQLSAVNHVMELSMKCQGWIAWPNDGRGPTWIPMDDWLWHLEDTKNHSLEGKGVSLGVFDE